MEKTAVFPGGYVRIRVYRVKGLIVQDNKRTSIDFASLNRCNIQGPTSEGFGA